MISLRALSGLLLVAGGMTSSAVQPEMFAPGVISTGDMELNAAFTPDGNTIYFTKRTVKAQQWIVVESHWRGKSWSEPVIASFSGTAFSDFDPFVSPDGEHLYFSSNRPISSEAKRDFDIWVVDRTANGWSAPRNLSPTVNSAADETYPTVTSSGTLYFSAVRDGQGSR